MGRVVQNELVDEKVADTKECIVHWVNRQHVWYLASAKQKQRTKAFPPQESAPWSNCVKPRLLVPKRSIEAVLVEVVCAHWQCNAGVAWEVVCEVADNVAQRISHDSVSSDEPDFELWAVELSSKARGQLLGLELVLLMVRDGDDIVASRANPISWDELNDLINHAPLPWLSGLYSIDEEVNLHCACNCVIARVSFINKINGTINESLKPLTVCYLSTQFITSWVLVRRRPKSAKFVQVCSGLTVQLAPLCHWIILCGEFVFRLKFSNFVRA